MKCHVGGTGHVLHRVTCEPILKAASCSADDQHFSLFPCIPQFFFFSTPRLLHRLALSGPGSAQSLCKEGTPLPASPRTPRDTSRRVAQPETGVCLDIKHQAATSAGLMKTSQLPVFCLTAERRSREMKTFSKCLSRAFGKKLSCFHEERRRSVITQVV